MQALFALSRSGAKAAKPASQQTLGGGMAAVTAAEMDDPFADGAFDDSDAAGGFRRHRRQSWQMAKEEAVSFILMSPSAAAHGVRQEASASPSEVVRHKNLFSP